ncbi:MAG: beta-lactamase family protein, partial [Spirochaetia bacterium]|nr:beta-lactamase family protein [Spirochaetia bacterium]
MNLFLKIFSLAFLLFLLGSCATSHPLTPGEEQAKSGESVGVVESQASVQLASNIVSILGGVTTDADFSFFVQAEDGRTIHYDRGASGMDTEYESASTSKWVTTTIILSLVERGFLSLDSRPQDFISWWPISAGDPLYNIRLRDLLSFTSGLVTEPGGLDTMDNPFGTPSNCARAIALSNANNGKTPATEFWYASTHLQVAGYMAVLARGAADWQEVFKEFQDRTGYFPTAKYDLPSAKNPRLAGGMHWNANEYVSFIRASYYKRILTPSMHDLARSDQLVGMSVPFLGSPIRMRLGED